MHDDDAEEDGPARDQPPCGAGFAPAQRAERRQRRKVRRVRQSIRAGEYENDLKLEVTVDRLLDVLLPTL